MLRGSLICLLVLAALPAGASDMRGFYPRGTLQYWKEQTPPGIRAAFRDDILRVVSDSEHRRLDSVRLDFPLECPPQNHPDTGEIICLDPFTFVAIAEERRIVMSMSSLRFWGDLALAYAWLQVNGKAIDTVTYYMAMLKYQASSRFPGGRYPRPLEALGIPEEHARADEATMSLFQDIYVSGIYFLLAHELAHVLYQDRGYREGDSRKQVRAREARADNWALDVLAKLGQAPGGAVYWLMANATWAPSRADFASDGDYQRFLETATHPTTSDRLRDLASALRERAGEFAAAQENPASSRSALNGVAGQLDDLARTLDEPGAYEAIALQGRTIALEDLRPRPAGTAFGMHTRKAAGDDPFSGSCRGTMKEGLETLPLTVSLTRSGKRVQGRYSLGVGIGSIEGEVQGNRLIYSWRYDTSSGQGVLVADAGGESLQGTWGYGLASSGAGTLRCRPDRL